VGSILDLHSASARFASLLGHQLSLLSVPSRLILGQQIYLNYLRTVSLKIRRLSDHSTLFSVPLEETIDPRNALPLDVQWGWVNVPTRIFPRGRGEEIVFIPWNRSLRHIIPSESITWHTNRYFSVPIVRVCIGAVDTRTELRIRADSRELRSIQGTGVLYQHERREPNMRSRTPNIWTSSTTGRPGEGRNCWRKDELREIPCVTRSVWSRVWCDPKIEFMASYYAIDTSSESFGLRTCSMLEKSHWFLLEYSGSVKHMDVKLATQSMILIFFVSAK
jgi:hypothetical protein